jgi:hypothetical protein
MGVRPGHGFSRAISEQVLSPSLHLAVDLYLSLISFGEQWSTSEFVPAEALGCSHERTLRTMNELCKAFHHVQTQQTPKTRPRANSAAPVQEVQPLDRQTIIAMQLCLITRQGPWLYRTGNTLVRRLRQCMEARNSSSQRFPTTLSLTSADQSLKNPNECSDDKILSRQLLLWVCHVGMLAAQSLPEEQVWFECQAASLAVSLQIIDWPSLRSILCMFGRSDLHGRDGMESTGQRVIEKCLQEEKSKPDSVAK